MHCHIQYIGIQYVYQTVFILYLDTSVFPWCTNICILSPIEIPSAPSIFLTPSLPMYNREDSFKMTCSLPNGITIKKTLFYKVEPGGSHKLAHNNKIYVINKPDFKIAGKYICIYTAEIMDRFIDSLESQSILVNIYGKRLFSIEYILIEYLKESAKIFSNRAPHPKIYAKSKSMCRMRKKREFLNTLQGMTP